MKRFEPLRHACNDCLNIASLDAMVMHLARRYRLSLPELELQAAWTLGYNATENEVRDRADELAAIAAMLPELPGVN